GQDVHDHAGADGGQVERASAEGAAAVQGQGDAQAGEDQRGGVRDGGLEGGDGGGGGGVGGHAGAGGGGGRGGGRGPGRGGRRGGAGRRGGGRRCAATGRSGRGTVRAGQAGCRGRAGWPAPGWPGGIGPGAGRVPEGGRQCPRRSRCREGRQAG